MAGQASVKIIAALLCAAARSDGVSRALDTLFTATRPPGGDDEAFAGDGEAASPVDTRGQPHLELERSLLPAVCVCVCVCGVIYKARSLTWCLTTRGRARRSTITDSPRRGYLKVCIMNC